MAAVCICRNNFVSGMIDVMYKVEMSKDKESYMT
jgi:hypothetical protein